MFTWGGPLTHLCHYDDFQTSRADHVSNHSTLGACCCAAPPIGARSSSTRIKSSHCGPQHFRQKQIEASGFMHRSRNGRMTLLSSQGPCGIRGDRQRRSRSADARLQEPMEGGIMRRLCAIQARNMESPALRHLFRPRPCFGRLRLLHTESGGKRERG